MICKNADGYKMHLQKVKKKKPLSRPHIRECGRDTLSRPHLESVDVIGYHVHLLGGTKFGAS